MNRGLLVVLGALICAYCADSGTAGMINHTNVTYTVNDWATYPYYYGRPDNTGDDLANGYLNGYTDNELNHENIDWVEFVDGGANLTFNLGASYNLESLYIGYFLAPGYGLPAPSSIDISFSNDNVNFTSPVNKTGFRAVNTEGYPAETAISSFSLAGNTAQYVNIFVHPASSGAWFHLGEFVFNEVPEPATMLLLGIGGLSMLRRK